MTRRTIIVMFALQGLSLAGLLVIGASVYQSKPEGTASGESIGSVAQKGERPDSGAGNSPAGDGSFGAKSVAPADQAARLQRMEERIARLEKGIERIGEDLAQQAAPRASKASGVTPTAEDLAEQARWRARGALDSRHLQETATSAWGESAESAIDRAYVESVASSSFLTQYKGDLATDCRESVCSLTWTPDKRATASLSAEAWTGFFEQAQMTLVELAASAPDAGQVKFSINHATDPPSIQLLIDNTGGDPMPSTVSRYFSSGKRSQQ